MLAMKKIIKIFFFNKLHIILEIHTLLYLLMCVCVCIVGSIFVIFLENKIK